MALGCRIFGHDYGFAADGRVMEWVCERCGAEGGKKVYDTPEEAARYASRFDRRPRGPANILAALGGRMDRKPRE